MWVGSGCASEIVSGKIDVLCFNSRPSWVLGINAGKSAGGFARTGKNIIAKNAPRGAFGDSIKVVYGAS